MVSFLTKKVFYCKIKCNIFLTKTMANRPTTHWNEVNKKSWLFLDLLDFLWTIPTEIKTEEDYKAFLTKLDQIEYTFRRISKRAITGIPAFFGAKVTITLDKMQAHI